MHLSGPSWSCGHPRQRTRANVFRAPQLRNDLHQAASCIELRSNRTQPAACVAKVQQPVDRSSEVSQDLQAARPTQVLCHQTIHILRQYVCDIIKSCCELKRVSGAFLAGRWNLAWSLTGAVHIPPSPYCLIRLWACWYLLVSCRNI